MKLPILEEEAALRKEKKKDGILLIVFALLAGVLPVILDFYVTNENFRYLELAMVLWLWIWGFLFLFVLLSSFLPASSREKFLRGLKEEKAETVEGVIESLSAPYTYRKRLEVVELHFSGHPESYFYDLSYGDCPFHVGEKGRFLVRGHWVMEGDKQ
jgi:hypothetical protein